MSWSGTWSFLIAWSVVKFGAEVRSGSRIHSHADGWRCFSSIEVSHLLLSRPIDKSDLYHAHGLLLLHTAWPPFSSYIFTSSTRTHFIPISNFYKMSGVDVNSDGKPYHGEIDRLHCIKNAFASLCLWIEHGEKIEKKHKEPAEHPESKDHTPHHGHDNQVRSSI